jgi:hypothetical protein
LIQQVPAGGERRVLDFSFDLATAHSDIADVSRGLAKRYAPVAGRCRSRRASELTHQDPLMYVGAMANPTAADTALILQRMVAPSDDKRPARRFCRDPANGGRTPAGAGSEARMRIDVYDPAMCCSTGVCGPQVDAQLVRFAADMRWLSGQGVVVQRHNLGQEPAAFMSDATVRRTLQAEGVRCLPLGMVDGAIVFRGGYPTRPELMRLLFGDAGTV